MLVGEITFILFYFSVVDSIFVDRENIYMEEVKDIRLVNPIEAFSVSTLSEAVPAGFPSPAQDHIDEGIDLNRELIRHPASTFCARVAGDSMRDCGIDDGDLLSVLSMANLPSNASHYVPMVYGSNRPTHNIPHCM